MRSGRGEDRPRPLLAFRLALKDGHICVQPLEFVLATNERTLIGPSNWVR